MKTVVKILLTPLMALFWGTFLLVAFLLYLPVRLYKWTWGYDIEEDDDE